MPTPVLYLQAMAGLGRDGWSCFDSPHMPVPMEAIIDHTPTYKRWRLFLSMQTPTKLVDSRDRSLWACRSGFSAFGFDILSFWVWDLEHLSSRILSLQVLILMSLHVLETDLLGLGFWGYRFGVLWLQVWSFEFARLRFWAFGWQCVFVDEVGVKCSTICAHVRTS